MAIFDRIKTLVQRIRVSRWERGERILLLRLLHSACLLDSEISASEREWLDEVASDMGLSWDEVQAEDAGLTVFQMCRDEHKREQVYSLLAQALFADGDFDKKEQIMTARLVDRHQLHTADLQRHIDQLRNRLMNEALGDWNRAIELGVPERNE